MDRERWVFTLEADVYGMDTTCTQLRNISSNVVCYKAAHFILECSYCFDLFYVLRNIVPQDYPRIRKAGLK